MNVPMTNFGMRLAGYGGQGVLFAGRVIANAGLLSGREVSWLPSYGPEMRGGTCNCSIIISDEPIGTPLVVDPDIVVAMNKLSFERFGDAIVPGGLLIADDSTFDMELETLRSDITSLVQPYAQLASDNDYVDVQGTPLGNLLQIGVLWKATQFCTEEVLDEALVLSIPERKVALLEVNRKALALGKEL